MGKAVQKQTKEKAPSLFQRFIFWFFIPLLFAIFLALLIASLKGVNVFEKAKEISGNIPIIAELNNGKEKASMSEYEDQINSLDVEIQEKNVQINQLQSQLNNKDIEKEELLLEIEKLQTTVAELQQIHSENKRAFKDIVTTFESMTPKKAAPIILEMNENEAVKILSNVNTELLAQILEKMPPDKAAMYSGLLAAKSN